jgi:type I restriction enzyme S subunit
MSENKLTYSLRFTEFQGKNTWTERKLNEVLFEHKQKSTGNEDVYSVSVHKGVINQIEHLGRSFSSSNTSNYKLVMPGDIIYTKSPTGDFPYGIIKQNKVSKAVIVSPLYGVFKPETKALGVILDAYFDYPERTINYLSSIIQKGAKNTININNETFLSKSLLLPSDKYEQQKIADCLTSLDDLISAHNTKLELLHNHKKGLMQNLFPQEGEKVPKWRFKEFEKDGEWVFKPLHELYSFLPTNSLSRDSLNFEFGTVKNVHYGDIHTKYSTLFDITQEIVPFINEDVLIHNFKKYNYCLEGDLLIADASEDLNDIGKCIEVVNLNNEKMLSGLHTLMARPIENELTIGFAGYLFKSNRIRRQIQKEAQGTKVLGISVSRISNIELFFPQSKYEQKSIIECLSLLDTLINAEIALIAKMKLHKKGLMQGLFPKMSEEDA